MFEGKTILAVIPARSGSKGVRGKNIRPLAGRPLLHWTVEAARQSGWIDRLIVSTDSESIAAIARDAGADVPFLRPAALATDTASSVDVLVHAVSWCREQGEGYDLLMLLQPTSPLRTAQDITSGLKIMGKRGGRAVVSVCECEHHPLWSNTLPPDGCMADFLPKNANVRRQDLPPCYRLNGAFFLAETGWFMEKRTFYGPETYALVMHQEHSVDIDSELDFRWAEFLLTAR